MFDAMPGIETTHVEQPGAQAFFTPAAVQDWDAFVLYDMPGIEFGAGGLTTHDPPPQYVENFRALLEAGHGFVFLHHAIAGWPTWPEYAEIIGGRFLYLPGELRGRALPDSGYRLKVQHRVRAVTDHPVLDGLADGFEIEDELYLFCPFEQDVTPLLRSDYAFIDSNFYSAAKVVLEGAMNSNEGWSHPPGSDLIAWTHRYANSPIVYIACGDSPNAYANDSLRRLIANAVRWVATEAKSARG